MSPEILTGLIVKVIGSVAGTILSLVYVWPQNQREAWRRAIGSLIIGVVFATETRSRLGIPDDTDGTLAAACLAAAAGWVAMGILYRLLRAYKKP